MRYLVVISFLIVTQLVHGQRADTLPTTGNIEEAEVIIEKERDLILPQAQRTQVTITPDNRQIEAPALQFEVEEPRTNLPAFDPSFRSVPLPPQEKDKLFSTEARAGYGNYGSPLFGIVHHGSLEQLRYGANFFHQSFANGPVRDDLSGSSETRLTADVSGNYAQTKLGLSAGWKSYGYYFYGLPDEAIGNDSSNLILDRASYNHFLLEGEIATQTKSREVIFVVAPRYDQLNNVAKDAPDIASETNLAFPANLTWNVDSVNQVGFDLVPQLSTYSTGDLEISRSLVSLSPWYSTAISVVKFRLGLQVNFVSDSSNVSNTQVGAVMSFQLPLGGTWVVDGGIDNRIKQNRLVDLYQDNWWLEDSLTLRSSIEKVPLWATVQGYPFPNVHMFASARIQDIEDALYYRPSETDSSRFTAVYEQDELGVFELKAGATVILKDDFTASANFAFFDYQPGSEIEAWYRPTSTLDISFTKGWNGLTWQTSLKLVNGLKAPSPSDGSIVDLSPITDLSMRWDYKVTESLSAFATFDNLLNQSYEYYLNYPSRRMTVKGGIRFRF